MTPEDQRALHADIGALDVVLAATTLTQAPDGSAQDRGRQNQLRFVARDANELWKPADPAYESLADTPDRPSDVV